MGFANIPEHPPVNTETGEPYEFKSSFDDETCPECGFDREEASMDYIKAYRQGVLLAAEQSEGSPFSAMSGTQLIGFYWRCPMCKTLFTTEEELTLGAMS